MQIDWLTVVAQIVNFLVLVWLLKRFLYRPVVEAMSRRESRIESRLADARRREQEAEAEAESFRGKSAALERDREQQLEQAREAADAEKRRLVEQAREEVDGMRNRWVDQLRREQDDFGRNLRKQLAAAIGDASRAVLSDLADTTLEDRAVSVLLRRLSRLPAEERESLAGPGATLRIATAFELGEESRARLRDAFPSAGGIEFTRDEEIGFGIVVRGPDHRLEWSASDYLGDLEQRLGALLPGPSTEGSSAAERERV